MTYRTLSTPGRLLAALVMAGSITALSAADAAAQDRPVRFSIAGGPTLPMSTLGDLVDMGYHAQLSAALSTPSLPVGIRLDGMFTQFPETGEEGNFRVISGGVNAILGLSSANVAPYLIGGLGVYNSSYTEDDHDHDHDHDHGGSTTNIGANLGVGVNMALSGLSVFGEARLHHLFNEGDAVRFAPISLGVRF